MRALSRASPPYPSTVWAKAGCTCADTAIGSLSPAARLFGISQPAAIIVAAEASTGETGGGQRNCSFAELACRPFGIPNDIQARAENAAAVACRNPDFHPRRTPDEPRLQRH